MSEMTFVVMVQSLSSLCRRPYLSSSGATTDRRYGAKSFVVMPQRVTLCGVAAFAANSSSLLIRVFLSVLCAHNDDFLTVYTGKKKESSGCPVVMRAAVDARLTRCACSVGHVSSLCAETTLNTNVCKSIVKREVSPFHRTVSRACLVSGRLADKSWRLQMSEQYELQGS